MPTLLSGFNEKTPVEEFFASPVFSAKTIITERKSLCKSSSRRYDLAPVSGEWRIPPHKDGNIAAAFMFPGGGVEVDVWSKKGFDGGNGLFYLLNRTYFM